MKRITVLTAAAVAMAVGAAPASASLPVVGQANIAGPAVAVGGDGGNASTGNTQVLNGNSAAVSILGSAESRGGDTSAKSGDAYGGNGGDAGARGGKGYAKGGDGGDADTGNRQFGNGNSLAVAPGGKPERSSCGKCGHEKGGRHEAGARSKGGDTHARSGDAYGGHGGNAKARGGDASERGKSRKRGCDRDHGKRHEESRSRVEQGAAWVFGGFAYAEGGDGGDADTGNTQFLNGNSLALSLFGDADSEGGDTYAKSGDAYGGNGGDAVS